MTTDMASVEHVVVLLNEQATNSARMQRQIGRLALAHDVVLTSRNAEADIYAVAAVMHSASALIVAGGDGTVHDYLNSLYRRPEAAEAGLHRLPTGFARGGDACDNAVDFGGSRASIQSLLQGRTMAVQPLESRIDDQPPRYALGYISVGSTAAAGRALDNLKTRPLLRHGGLPLQAWSALHATAQYRGFNLITETGERRPATSVAYFNGGRMAKLGRPHGVQGEPLFETVVTNSPGIPATLGQMARLGAGLLYGAKVQAARAGFESRSGEPLPIQYDGEADWLPSGSNLTVRLAERPFTAITTKRPTAQL